MNGLKPLTRETMRDALDVIARCFSLSDCKQVEKILENPLLRCQEASGDVAYFEDRAVGTQLAIKRRLFLNGEPFWGTIGAMLAMDVGVPPVLLVELMKSTKGERWERQLYFANTAIPVSMKMNRMIGVKGVGVESCGIIRYAVLKPLGFVDFVLKGRLPKFVCSACDTLWRFVSTLLSKRVCVETNINEDSFDVFWTEYLKTSRGVVSSRTAAELKWAFESDIRSGKTVLVVERKEGRIIGYIVIKEARQTPGRWMVVDWIALDDNAEILGKLLSRAKKYLAKNKTAFMLESIGFPMRIQGLIHKHLPLTRRAPNNSYIYQAFNPELDAAIKSDEGWFFGPYDGDRFLS